MINECVITQQEICEYLTIDEFAMAGILKDKGFKCKSGSGPILPVLVGDISMIQNPDTLNYHFKQVATNHE